MLFLPVDIRSQRRRVQSQSPRQRLRQWSLLWFSRPVWPRGGKSFFSFYAAAGARPCRRLLLSSLEVGTEPLPGWPGWGGEPSFSSCGGVAGGAGVPGGAPGSPAGRQVRRGRWREQRSDASQAEVQRGWIQQLRGQKGERWDPRGCVSALLLQMILSSLHVRWSVGSKSPSLGSGSMEALHSTGGGGGGHWGGAAKGSGSLNEQIVVALARLQDDMQSVLERLHTLEALTASQVRAASSQQTLTQKLCLKDIWGLYTLFTQTFTPALFWRRFLVVLFLLSWLLQARSMSLSPMCPSASPQKKNRVQRLVPFLHFSVFVRFCDCFNLSWSFSSRPGGLLTFLHPPLPSPLCGRLWCSG